jgi:hypothetical protein
LAHEKHLWLHFVGYQPDLMDCICRGHFMVALVEASKRVATCQQEVQQAKQALEEAQTHLAETVAQTEAYVVAETAEREAEDAAKQHRSIATGAENAARSHEGVVLQSVTSPVAGQAPAGSAAPPVIPTVEKNGSGPVAITHDIGAKDGARFQLGMKPFTISLNAS